jgi:predicted NodU family carbamoyl transferase
MYLPAAAADAGGAIGAACVVQSQLDSAEDRRSKIADGQREIGDGKSKMGAGRRDTNLLSTISQLPRRFRLETAYLGPHFSNDEIEDLLRSRDLLPSTPVGQAFLPAEPASPLDISPLLGLPAESTSHLLSSISNLRIARIGDDAELCARTARAIADGLVIGWFQGRMEWGPRALGNRSILCDPRRADMKDILNAKIKRRESFRPFAPSILREAVGEWFEQDDDVPFMMQVFNVREEKRALIPAVTHVDGSGRLQTVHLETNPLYHQLISEFCSLTSVPLVLNTSFNENEPVVCRPEEAVDCFLRTKMDVLVLENFFLERRSQAWSREQGARSE